MVYQAFDANWNGQGRVPGKILLDKVKWTGDQWPMVGVPSEKPVQIPKVQSLEFVNKTS